MRLVRCFCFAVAASQFACAGLIANLPTVIQDIAAIAQVVYNDVIAGKPFAQVLADTGTDDASLLVALLTSMQSDSKMTAAQRATYGALCAPYLTAAKALQAKQQAQGLYRHTSSRVLISSSGARIWITE